MSVPNRFTALDGLRGLAALVVVFFHLRRELRDLGAPETVDRLVTGGYLMVDLFFVLSGFVLARTLLRTDGLRSAARFAALRVRRFMPLHLTGWTIALAGVSFAALCQALNLFHTPEAGAFTHDDTTPRAWITSFFLVQGFVGPLFAGYAAAWSLSIELWANILVVVVIAVLAPRLRSLVGPVALVAGAVILSLTPADAENTVGWVAFGRGLGGLGAGMVAYELYLWLAARPGRKVRAAMPLGVIGLLLVVLACWERELVRELRFLPMLGLAVLLVISLALPTGGPAQWLLNRPVAQWLGSRSFAIYALHGPVLVTFELVISLAGLDQDAPPVAAALVSATLAGTFVAAEIGHRYIEQAWLPRRKAPAQPAREPVPA
ncbi:acyltransferase [Kineosporia rhizophila]|uniref:acyltransferase family protein n=1 Tax=Kineosporia rhizophila TaxID=84633 RepID=UPI001E474A1F|nr:acyltransferase [Kineosporia rhizophila]MCE0537088.1 acyltransferase [Kineosporia rhizophila]